CSAARCASTNPRDRRLKMPIPKWSRAKEAPIAAAIAAAVHEAWDGPEEGRSTRFVEALLKMVGPDVLERIELAALRILRLQMSAPEGYEYPQRGTVRTSSLLFPTG